MMQQSPNSSGGELTQQQQQQQQWMVMQQQQQQLQQQYQQQQWMAMHQHYPPAAAMAMQQHQLMYQQPHYIPYHYLLLQQQQQQQQQHQYQQQHQHHQYQHQHQHQHHGVGHVQSSSEENKTIWIGDLQPWMDEAYLHSCFQATREVVSVKVIRNKQSNQSERFGFIEFVSHAAAEKVLQSYNGTAMPTAEQAFRLNWATFSTSERRQDAGSDQSIFVGDLASDVTDTILFETFSTKYPSVRGANVVVDANTGRSKGYGFVKFGDENEKSRAVSEMNGQYCCSRPMRIGVATPKKSSAHQQYSSHVVLSGGAAANGAPSETDSANTTVFVGGLDSDVTEEELGQSFSQCGEVLSVKIPVGKGCGFVQFSNRTSAEDSIEQLNGTVIGKQTVRLSWGRSPRNSRLRTDSGNQWNGNYYGKQVYNSYEYTVPQDPNMYASSYGASTNGYGNQ